MKKPKAEVDATNDGADALERIDETTQRLLEIDEWTRSGSIVERRSESGNSIPGEEDVADCLSMIERVRQYHPGCLAEFQLEDTAQTPWLDGEDAPPQRFGRFEIRRRLGEGGFALVFLALDPNLDREVALKLPRIATLTTELTRQRFLREAKAAAALDHPNIAAIYESDQVGPVCYIAAAYCDGGSLAEYLHQHKEIDPKEAARAVAVLADAVHYAHSRGILHRDLKPGNVLIDSSPEPHALDPSSLRVSDFGLARIIEDETHATLSGTLVGTPAYMSPEQAEGKHDQVSTASDIYALGAILYELLTGRPPFQASSTLAVLEEVRSREPTPPRRLRNEIPRDLEAICLKCLEKSPGKRYASANALAEELEAWLDGKSITARTTTRPERFLRWCRRNPALAAVSAVAVVAMLVGSFTSTVLWRRAERNASREETRSRELAEAVDNLNSAIDMLFVTVAESDELRSYDAEPLRQKLLDQAQRYYQLVASHRPLDTRVGQSYAETLFRLGLVHKQLGDANQADKILEKALHELASLPDSDRRLRLQIEWTRRRAQVLDQLGRFDEARRLQRDAVRAAKDATESTTNDGRPFLLAQALLWSDMAGGELIESDLKTAGVAAANSLQAWNESIDSDARDHTAQVVLGYANTLLVLGISNEEGGKLTEAEGHLRSAVKFLERHDCTRDVVDLTLLLGRARKKLGIALAKQDRYDDAREAYLSALATFEGLVERHPRVPEYRMELCSSRYSLSVTEYLAGDQIRTLELLNRNVEEYAQLAEAYPDQQVDYWNRAGIASNMLFQVHQDRGDTQAATGAIQRALQYYTQVEAERPNWTFNQVVLAESEINLAKLLFEQRNLDEAPELLEVAKGRVARVVDDQPQHDRARRALHDSHSLHAKLHLQAGDFSAAKQENEAALGLLADAHAWQTILQKAELLGHDEEFEEARQTLEQFLSQTANAQKHFLGTARSAAKIMQLDENQESMHEALHAIGVEALRRAEPAAELEREAFRKMIEEDELLKPFLGLR